MMKKRADGRYLKFVPYEINGIKKSKPIYGYTEAEVVKKEEDFKKQLESDRLEIENPLFPKLIDKWYEDHCKTVRPNTADCYVKPVADCKEWFAKYKIKEIKPLHIKEFIDDLISKGFARQTINLRYIVLCKTFNYAIFLEMVQNNSAKAYTLPRGLKSAKRETLTDEQIRTVSESKHIYANILLYTGCRRNEALALTWEDIDFTNNQITINKQLYWDGGIEIIPTTKTSAGTRTIPLLKPLRDLLEPIENKGNIIPLMSEGTFQRYWKAFQNDTKLKVTPHQFRHAYITILYKANIDAKTAQKYAGHAKITTTMDIYTHLANDIEKEQLKKLNDYLENSQKFSQ